jgi:hypothetical protein
MSKRALVPINVLAVATAPTGSYPGDVYYNTDEKNLYVFDGAQWFEIVTNAAADILEGGNEAGGSDTYTATIDGGNEAGGSDAYTLTYDGGGVI